MTHLENSEPGSTLTNVSSSEEQQPLEAKPPRAYVTPIVLSHSGERLLEELGPAQACYPFSSCGVTP